MKDKPIYEVISRVVNNGEVIGFMVSPVSKKSQEIYMSSEVVSFGLEQKTFEIKNVKLSNSGKPRGYNGFLLSKLPVVDLEDENKINLGLYRVLLAVVKTLGVTDDIRKCVKFGKIGVIANCSVTLILDEYSDMDLEVANRELNKNLKFYFKHLPRNIKCLSDKIEGTVESKGLTTLIVYGSLIKGVTDK